MPMYVSFIDLIENYRFANLFADYDNRLLEDNQVPLFLGSLKKFCEHLGATEEFLSSKTTITEHFTIPLSKEGNHEIVVFTKKGDDDEVFELIIKLKHVTYFVNKDNGGILA